MEEDNFYRVDSPAELFVKIQKQTEPMRQTMRQFEERMQKQTEPMRQTMRQFEERMQKQTEPMRQTMRQFEERMQKQTEPMRQTMRQFEKIMQPIVKRLIEVRSKYRIKDMKNLPHTPIGIIIHRHSISCEKSESKKDPAEKPTYKNHDRDTFPMYG